MRYEGKVYRPPSEARSYILQATIGCSHNLCTYCDMYRAVRFRERPLSDLLEDITEAGLHAPDMDKVFVADGDALVMGVDRWLAILEAARAAFPRLRRVSCYATAENILEKTPRELDELRQAGLSLLYIGPESGDDETLRRIVKGGTFKDHADAALKAHEADIASRMILTGMKKGLNSMAPRRSGTFSARTTLSAMLSGSAPRPFATAANAAGTSAVCLTPFS